MSSARVSPDFCPNVGTRSAAVHEQEVHVGRRQTLLPVDDRTRHRQFDDGERPAVLIAKAIEAASRAAQRLVVLILRVALDADHDRPLVDEAREIVDVPVGVVAGDALAEPDDVPLSVEALQVFLDLLAREIGIAVLVQQARRASSSPCRRR